MPVFPSSHWIDEYCARLAAHPGAEAVAYSLDGLYRFVIDPGGPLTQRHHYGVEIRPPAAAPLRVVAHLDPPAEGAALSISAAYPQWRKLISGTLDLPMALMLRRIKVGGNLQRLTSRLSSAQPLLDALGAVNTIWLEDV